MRERRYKSFSIRGPIILFVVVLVLIITLTVLWNVVLVHDYNKLRELAVQSGVLHWTLIALGSALFMAIIVLSCILVIRLINNIRWSQHQSDFIASVSHELNSPLSSIKLFAQTIRKDDLTAQDRRSFVDKIIMDVSRLTHLISNIVRAAEVDHRRGELQVVLQDVELHSYLGEYIAHCRPVAEDRLQVTLDGKPEHWVKLDRLMFQQVLDNLIDNAIRYCGQEPAKVLFRLGSNNGTVELQIVDQGIGIPKSELAKVFDRFYRVERRNPEENRKGMGIGLNVVRTILHSHGASVEARSQGTGQGTEIWMRLPRIEKPKAHSEPYPAS
ncbi:MAG: HAMP domain-containing sensor histidine kinase [Planctomycetota bacterium]